VEGAYKFSKEQLGSTKFEEFLDQMMTYLLLKDSAPRSCGAIVITAIIVVVIVIITTTNNKI